MERCTIYPTYIPITDLLWHQHLDEFELIDKAFIQFNKMAIVVFTYHMIRFSFTEKNISWDLRSLGILNGPGSLIAMHIGFPTYCTVDLTLKS